MLWLSLSYSIISLVILSTIFGIVVYKQLELKCYAVYYLLIVILAIIGWVIGDLMQVIYSSLENIEIVLFFSRFATISSMVAMLSTVLFARVLTARRTLNSINVAIAFILFGSVVALTLSSGYKVVSPPKEVEFYKTEAELLWVILDALMVLFAGTLFLRYVIRQRKIVQKKYLSSLNLIIIGVIFAFYVSAILYSMYAIWFVVPLLHLELVSASIGASLIGIAMLRGGKEVIYYSSRVFSLNILNEDGLSYYSCVFQSGYSVDEHLVSGLAAAISNFANELIGEETFPREIDLGNYSLLLAKKEKIIILVAVEFPTANLKKSIENIIEEYSTNMTNEKISKIVEKYMSFEPITVL